MDHLRSIQVRAAWEATRPRPTDGYSLRQVLRWYSKTFFVPLPQVESEIPVDDVLQTYYETVFGELAESDDPQDQASLWSQIRELIRTPDDERAEAARVFKESSADEDFHAKMMRKLLKEPEAPPVPGEDISMNFKDLEAIERENEGREP